MATIGNLLINLRANTGPFGRQMRGAQKHVSGFQKSVNTLKTTMKGLAVYFGARMLLGKVSEAVQLFREQEQATARLSAALGNLGVDARAATKDFEAFAAGIQKQTTLGDEAVIALGALGAGLGKLSGQQLKDATTAAIGLSKAFGIQLEASMRLVARAAIGDTAMLTRYGIKLNELLSPSQKFNELLRIGADNFRVAQAEAGTLTGQLDQLKNTWSDMLESVGKKTMEVAAGWKYFIDQARGKQGVPIEEQLLKERMDTARVLLDHYDQALAEFRANPWAHPQEQLASLRAMDDMLVKMVANFRMLKYQGALTLGGIGEGAAQQKRGILAGMIQQVEAKALQRSLQDIWGNAWFHIRKEYGRVQDEMTQLAERKAEERAAVEKRQFDRMAAERDETAALMAAAYERDQAGQGRFGQFRQIESARLAVEGLSVGARDPIQKLNEQQVTELRRQTGLLERISGDGGALIGP